MPKVRAPIATLKFSVNRRQIQLVHHLGHTSATRLRECRRDQNHDREYSKQHELTAPPLSRVATTLRNSCPGAGSKIAKVSTQDSLGSLGNFARRAELRSNSVAWSTECQSLAHVGSKSLKSSRYVCSRW